MFDWLEDILNKIREMNTSIDKYKKDTVIQSLPSFAYVNRAKKLIEQNYLLEAEYILNSALSLPQEDALVYKYLGIIADKTGRKGDAIAAYKKSANINPNDKDIWKQLGFALVSSNQPEEAVESFENANKISPMNSDVFTGWGMALLKLKKYNDAHDKFMLASKIDKYNFMAMLLAAIVEMKLKQYDEAETKLKFLSSVCPNESNTYEYAHLKYLQGDYEASVHYAKKALTFNRNMLPAYVLLGEVYYRLNDETNSLAAYNQAFQNELVNDNLYFEWGIALQVFEKYDEACEKFHRTLELNPIRNDAKAGLALCAAFQGDTDTADAMLKGLEESVQKSYPAEKARGFCAMHKGDFNKAIQFFKEVLKENSFDKSLIYYIAQSYEYLNNDVLAKEYYEKSLKENSSYLPAYLNYAKYLINKKDYADCQRKLRRALKVDGNNPEILNLLFYVSYILVKDNVCEYNLKETLEIADKIIALDSGAFKYPTEKDELSVMLKNIKGDYRA